MEAREWQCKEDGRRRDGNPRKQTQKLRKLMFLDILKDNEDSRHTRHPVLQEVFLFTAMNQYSVVIINSI